MKFYILVALLPYVFATDIRTFQCPDGTTCSVGKTCCRNGEYFECCDLPEVEQQNKKLVLAFSPVDDVRNVSHSSCSGTKCPLGCCKFRWASCCPGNRCCPSGTKCCGSPMVGEWCCKRKQRCAASYMHCFGGAPAISPAFLSVIAIVFVAVSLKHF